MPARHISVLPAPMPPATRFGQLIHSCNKTAQTGCIYSPALDICPQDLFNHCQTMILCKKSCDDRYS